MTGRNHADFMDYRTKLASAVCQLCIPLGFPILHASGEDHNYSAVTMRLIIQEQPSHTIRVCKTFVIQTRPASACSFTIPVIVLKLKSRASIQTYKLGYHPSTVDWIGRYITIVKELHNHHLCYPSLSSVRLVRLAEIAVLTICPTDHLVRFSIKLSS